MRVICAKLGISERATPHDLRRTHGTMITRLGFGRDAMNRIQNHKDGGIASVYDRYEYAEEDRRIMEAVAARGAEIGVTLVTVPGAATASLQFDYGFKVRPFFPRLIEPVAQRRAWLDEQNIDRQIVGTWPDIFGYGLGREACVAWHGMLNDTLAQWTQANSDRFAWLASAPLTDADAAARALERGVAA